MMRKRVISFLLISVLCLMMGFTVCAENSDGHLPRMVDNADLLTSEEEEALTVLLDEYVEKENMDILILTENSLGGEAIDVYAMDYYDYTGYGVGENNDGIMLIVSMEEREWYLVTTGACESFYPNSTLEAMSEEFLGDLGDGYYYDAFKTFIECCYTYMEIEDQGGIAWFEFVAMYALAAILAFVPMYFMMRKMKNVRPVHSAKVYVTPGSEQVTKRRDVFLYHTISKTPKPKNTQTGSSGRSHGGTGGSF